LCSACEMQCMSKLRKRKVLKSLPSQIILITIDAHNFNVGHRLKYS